MSSDVIDLPMCACLCVPVTDCTCVRIGCTATARRVAAEPIQFSGRVDLVSPVCYHMVRSHVTAAVFKLGRTFTTLSSQILLKKKIDSAVNLEMCRVS